MMIGLIKLPWLVLCPILRLTAWILESLNTPLDGWIQVEEAQMEGKLKLKEEARTRIRQKEQVLMSYIALTSSPKEVTRHSQFRRRSSVCRRRQN